MCSWRGGEMGGGAVRACVECGRWGACHCQRGAGPGAVPVWERRGGGSEGQRTKGEGEEEPKAAARGFGRRRVS